jgi:hypothetical protein
MGEVLKRIQNLNILFSGVGSFIPILGFFVFLYPLIERPEISTFFYFQNKTFEAFISEL